jgi:RimJ/RimL family protein N-acetyltransferase
MSAFELSTERFLLRTLTESDASTEYLSWLSSPFIMDKSKSLSALKTYIKQFDNVAEAYFLAIIDKVTYKHIGNIKFIFHNKYKEVEMGILIGDVNYRGIGAAAEVIRCFGFFSATHYQTKSMILGVEIENTPAISAYKKLGFIKVDKHPLIKNHINSLIMVWSLTNIQNKNQGLK